MTDPLTLRVRRLHPDAHLPTKAHADDMGWDLRTVETIPALKEGIYPIRTGIAVELPPGWAALILGRSSLAAAGLFPIGGCIDPGYRGEWVVNLYVSRHCGRYLNAGEKVAQFILLAVPEAVVTEVDKLSPTDRGDKGFGSSGR